MRTSGKGGGDIFMMTVPVLILVVVGLLWGGGFGNVVHMAELTLWTAVEFVSSLFS